MTPDEPANPELTVYWRPGCGFCHVLRRGLDRAGVGRQEVNIWEDREAAARVRSVASGNETVPTVLVGDRAMVNPSVADVLSALGRAPALSTPHRSAPAWREVRAGAGWSLTIAAGWVALALANPTTTYHLAPLGVALAWSLAGRNSRDRSRWSSGLVPALGGALAALLAFGLLMAKDALGGPVLIGSDAPVESLLLLGLGTGLAVLLARPRRAAVS